MAYAFPGAGALDYSPCQYGASRLIFRGPAADVSGAMVACLGGSETYGRFVARPWPALLEDRLRLPVLNLGCMNAGADIYLQDQAALDLAARARAVVVQLTGAQGLSNRYYTVHPRRNDRLVRVTPLLQSLFPDVDFTQFHFIRHMLAALQDHDHDAFEVVAEELRATWVARMKALLRAVTAPTVLLWLADHAPPSPCRRADLRSDPLLVDAEMLATLRPMVRAVVQVLPGAAARLSGLEGMIFDPIEAPAAAFLPGPMIHDEVAAALAPVLRGLV